MMHRANDRSVVFLGAGASKAFGIKTLQEMSEDLLKTLEKNHAKSTQVIVQNLKKYSLEPDFEAIYTIIQAMADYKQAIKTSGPLTAYVCSDSTPLISPEECRELLHEFKAFLLQACQPNPSSMDKITRLYSELFRVIYDSKYVEHPRWEEDKEGVTIITTNYDMIMELYFWNSSIPFADGFIRKIEQPHIGQLDLTDYNLNHLKSNTFWLIKLHGSIWMYKHKGAIFKTIMDPKTCPIPVKIEDEMMIFPVKEKPILNYPYYNFYDLFRNENWNKLVVIGYSFRDEAVNCAILDNLRRFNDSRIVVIDPNPKAAIDNFISSSNEEMREKIIPVKGYFGEDDVFERLKIALSSWSPHHYETKLSEYYRQKELQF